MEISDLKEPTIARDTVLSHLGALKAYLSERGETQAYAAVHKLVDDGLSGYPAGSRIPGALVGKNLDLVSQWLNEPNIGLKLSPGSTRLHPKIAFFFKKREFALYDYCCLLQRYLSLMTEVLTIEIEEQGDKLILSCVPHPDIYVSPHQHEGFVTSLCDAILDNFALKPSAISFRHNLPKQLPDAGIYQRILGLMPDFGSGRTCVIFPLNERRDNSVRSSAEASFRSLQELEAAHLKSHPTELWSERCLFLLELLLCYGEPTKNAVADLLAVTPRTLQRRLTDEETSFRELLNALRLKLAKKYLKQAEYSLEDITFLLGFKDVGVFYRSFKSWTDQTPGEYRAMVQG
ncbi:MAG: helix-turn-helix domain-containing protein [Thalassolituus sp.]